jgi:hypothetical protein
MLTGSEHLEAPGAAERQKPAATAISHLSSPARSSGTDIDAERSTRAELRDVHRTREAPRGVRHGATHESGWDAVNGSLDHGIGVRIPPSQGSKLFSVSDLSSVSRSRVRWSIPDTRSHSRTACRRVVEIDTTRRSDHRPEKRVAIVRSFASSSSDSRRRRWLSSCCLRMRVRRGAGHLNAAC